MMKTRKSIKIDGIQYQVGRLEKNYPTSSGPKSLWVLLRKTHESGGAIQDAKVYLDPDATLAEAVKRLTGE
jgi:hypothetical protein